VGDGLDGNRNKSRGTRTYQKRIVGGGRGRGYENVHKGMDEEGGKEKEKEVAAGERITAPQGGGGKG